MEDLIDNEDDKSSDSVVMELIHWWERRRIPYTILLILIVVYLVIVAQYEHPQRTYIRLEFIVVTLIYLFFANLFYCLGWGIPLIIYHYFKVKPTTKSVRLILFTMGVVLSVFVTLIFYSILIR